MAEDGAEYEQYTVASDGSNNFDNGYAFRINNMHPYLAQCLYAGKFLLI